MDSSVNVLFVLPTECPANEDLQNAFEACKTNNLSASWCKEEQCADLQLAKTDIVVFQKFEGEAFEKLQSLKCVRIVGPSCLLACLMKDQQIPNYPWPIFSIAMHDCIISCSSFAKPMRKLIKSKIECMGGYFSANLTDTTTHLVTDSVKSEKYIKAAEANVKIMLSSWVDDVWEQCQRSDILCTDTQFEKHKCPIFYKLVICCTGFNNQKRIELKSMITQHGGSYSEHLHVKSTDFLVCESGGASAKYKAARKHDIKCVNMRWVTESVRSGYALSDEQYKIVAGTSTPTKDSENMPPNFSMISNIGNQSVMGSTHLSIIDMSDVTKLSCLTPVKEKSTLKRKSESSERDALIDAIDLKQAKRAGAFLDGCGVYLAGFSGDQREKLCKVLNFSGATRYDDISERVTHVIVGDESSHELKALAMRISTTDCVVVNVQWLLESMNKQQPVDEQNFILKPANFVNDPSSPLSKKGLHVLRTKSNTPSQEIEIPILQSEPDIDIVQLYSQCNPLPQEDTLANLLKDAENFDSNVDFSDLPRQSPVPQSNSQATEASSAVDDSSSQQFQPIFSSFKFMVLNFSEDQQNSVVLAIEAMAGKVVSKSYKGIPDYIVVPVFSFEVRQTANEIVNDFWISECWQENELRPIEYFHKPIAVKQNINILKGCVVTISSYINYERNYLKNLILRLGGVCQEQFSRIESAKNNIVASTHLVSPEASGKKYEAAVKWGLPVVNKDWLMECARMSCLINETPYLIEDPKCKTLQKSTESLNNTNFTAAMVSVSTVTKTPLQKLNFSGAGTPNSHVQRNSLYNTPTITEKLNSMDSVYTPENKLIRNVQNLSGVCSQITPVQKILAEARKNNLLGTPDQSLQCPSPWDHVNTPDTPLGAFIRANPSPGLRKEMQRYLNALPEHKPRRDSTPLSELKRQLWRKLLPDRTSNAKQLSYDSGDESETVEQPESVEQPSTSSGAVQTPPKTPYNGIHKLTNLISSKTSSSGEVDDLKRQSVVRLIEESGTEPTSISWDEECKAIENPKAILPIVPKSISPIVPKSIPPIVQKSIPVFMLSGIDKDRREELVKQIERLGGVVTNLSNFDPMCSHLICPKPTRNEKILACMAAGKWILHPSYLDQCISEGKLINEEPYEFGNPESLRNGLMQYDKETQDRYHAMHYWRKEIYRRGYGAFYNVRAIVLAQKKDSIARIIVAGGGIVVEASPPFKEPIHATLCLLNFKSLTDASEYTPLAKLGILCVNCIYVNDFLHKTTNDVKDYILPQLKKYYQVK